MAAQTDPQYRQMAEAALGYARNEFKDELAALKKENAALKRKTKKSAGHGHGPVVEENENDSTLILALQRGRALALFLAMLSCTTAILEGYEETLAAHVSLSFFVPFLIGHGGNCGGMSVGAVISAIARGKAQTPQVKTRLALREIVAGFCVALQLAALAAATLHFIGLDRGLSLVVVVSLSAITALGAVCGSVVPLLFDYMGLDAATVAPPAVTTLIDALGIVIYLTVAQLVLDVAPHDHGGAAAATAAVHNAIEDVAQAAGAAAAGEL